MTVEAATPTQAVGAPAPVAGSPGRPSPPSPASGAAPGATSNPQAAALLAMTADAAAMQSSLGNLLSDLRALTGSRELPAAATADANLLAAVQAPLDGQVTGEALRAAMQRSGIFLEAQLAAAILAGADAGPVMNADLKAQLLRLAADLAARPQLAPPSPNEAIQPALIPPAYLGQAPLPVDRPPPPVRGGAPRGQAPPRPTPDLRSGGGRAAQAIKRDADSALARVELSQAASVPRPGEAGAWTFEIPVATPGGAGVAQFEISRDGHQSQDQGFELGWRARFSLHAEPTGPVHADISLSGGRMHVTLWAERSDGAAELSARHDELLAALGGGEAEDVTVRIMGGAPTARAPAQPGQLVDQRS